MKNSQIKYLEGSFAKVSNNRADFLFLLRLKGAYTEGFISDSLSVIGNNIGESRNTALVRLRSLEKLGWVCKYQKNKKPLYKLISYDDLYRSLGYEFKANGKGFKGCYSLYKIPTSICIKSKKELEVLICAYDHIKKSERMTILSKREKGMIREGVDKINGVPLSFSCQSSASLMGFKSPKKGFEIQKKLEQRSIITVERSSKCVGRYHSFQYKMLRESTSIFKDSARFYHDADGYGFVWEKESNKFKVDSLLSLLPYNLQKQTKDQDFFKRKKSILGF